MSTMPEYDNPLYTPFEARMNTDLMWIKDTLKTILSTCSICHGRINNVESQILQTTEWKNRQTTQEERIRQLELGMTQVKAVGGILGTMGGLVMGIIIKLWPGSS